MNKDLLGNFLTYLAVEKGLARNTVESYERDLRKYSVLYEGQGTRQRSPAPMWFRS